jgi:hypothetical protein
MGCFLYQVDAIALGQIRSDLDFANHADYLHWNPVKHGCVIRVADWPYSSFHRYVAEVSTL